MSDSLKTLFDSGGLIAWAAFLAPGFVAWRYLQARRPQGEQKAADAIVTVTTFSIVVAVLWFAHPWTGLPATWLGALLFLVQILVTPLILVGIFIFATDYAVGRGWITSRHPRTWDYIFNDFVINSKKLGYNDLFMIVTLQDGSKIAGAYVSPGYASLWPYDRDLFLTELWQLDENDQCPLRRMTGSVGIDV